MIFENNPALFVTSYGSYVCPLCAREWDGGSGFRKAGAKRHVYTCWQRDVKARGLTVGDWSEQQNGYALIPISVTKEGRE